MGSPPPKYSTQAIADFDAVKFTMEAELAQVVHIWMGYPAMYNDEGQAFYRAWCEAYVPRGPWIKSKDRILADLICPLCYSILMGGLVGRGL
jgi:hypothetical protein